MLYQALIKNVAQLEGKIGVTEPTYFDSIEKLSNVRDDLRRLDVGEHLLGIIRPFLIRWGTMARVVRREGLDWAGFCQKLRDLEPEFAKLRGKRFIEVDLDNEIVSGAIETVYEELKSFLHLGGPTCVSKVLHLLNPEIFVMWYGKIRKAYHQKNRFVNDFPEGYLEFLKQAQKEMREAFKDYQSSSGKGFDEIEQETRHRFKNKTMVRIIDEYNYVSYTLAG